ncbi:MAG TPA: GNAT family N-acetyltransferase [Nitriliruptoraceae bacterium]|nr:GNAT family N-acetyltransferase [Nitriliruptoraceae bacterium]
MTTIRTATPTDAATILAFIVDLAVYEREPDAVEATEEQLAAQLASDRPPFECLIASHDVDGSGDRDVGMALFFPTYSTWTGVPGIRLEDLWVDPAARGRGIGLALLRELATLTLARGGARLEWDVLDWNTPSIDFYEAVGAVAKDDWLTYRLADDALVAMAEAARRD